MKDENFFGISGIKLFLHLPSQRAAIFATKSDDFSIQDIFFLSLPKSIPEIQPHR